MYSIYKWEKVEPYSPHAQTRNLWLWSYGAFARYSGVWFPCRVLQLSTIGEPAIITAIPLATVNMDLYPMGQINAQDCDVIYSVFGNGLSIEQYLSKELRRKQLTERMLSAGIRRSLNTELIFSTRKLAQEVKKAVNREDKAESFIVNVNHKDDIGAIPLPRTIEIVERLWDSKDWAVQEISQMLGLTYNPAHGKKERMIQSEALGDRDLTLMNRELLTSRLITAAETFGEKVIHISTEIDEKDRQLRSTAESVTEV